MRIAHRLPAGSAARPRLSTAPAPIPTPPPGPFEQAALFCQDLPPPRTPNRSAPPRNPLLRRRAARTTAACREACKIAPTIVTSALLLFLTGLAVYKHAPVANPPQPPAGRHSPCPHPGSPFTVVEFQ